MKLWDIPEKSTIRVTISSPGNEEGEKVDCTFHHIDGMYSYITTPTGAVVHLKAGTPMKLVGDHYEIDNSPDM